MAATNAGAAMDNLESALNNINPELREGTVARKLEEQTAKIPSDVWLWAAFGSIGLSLAFKIAKKDNLALFVGQWPPTFLILGVYNKLVKQLGSD
jgi:hypothetical protein